MLPTAGSSSSADLRVEANDNFASPQSVTSRASSDFDKNFANRTEHESDLFGYHAVTVTHDMHTPHTPYHDAPQTLGDDAMLDADQVGCRATLDGSDRGLVYHPNMATEAAQIDSAAASGDAAGHPGVVTSLPGTHPDAISKIWDRVRVNSLVTLDPLSDGLNKSNDSEICNALSPTIDCLIEPIGKHGALALPHGIKLPTGINGVHWRVNDGFIKTQPSGIDGVYAEDSNKYCEYESRAMGCPEARGDFASNLPRPHSGKNYLQNFQHTIDRVAETTMGNVCKNVLAICNVSSAAFARAAVTDMSKVITVPVQKQQLITELFKTSKTRSSLMALGIFYGLMDLFSDETRAMPPKGALCFR